MQKASATLIQEEQTDTIVSEMIWQPEAVQDFGVFGKLFDKEKVHLLGFLAAFFFLPPFIFWAAQTPKLFNYIAFGVVFFSLVGYARFGKFTLHELGFRWDTLKSSLLTYGLFSGGVSVLLYILYLGQWFHHSQQGSAPTSIFLLFYIFLASPAQEYIYRGVLFAEMKRRGLRQAWLQILISGSSFALLHMYHYDYYTVGVTLVMGLSWSILYQKHPNMLYVTLSHMLLGTIAILIRMV
jgi:uncharacterized protein